MPNHAPRPERPRRAPLATLIALACALVVPTSLRATTKGLNQIVTPDIQTEGLLSISGQVQDSRIGNSQEAQFELGLTPRLEVAYAQGLKPTDEIFGAELNLVQKGPHLLSVGAVNWSARGGGASPVAEYGYYAGNDHLIAGVIRSNRRTEGILGYARQVSERLQLAFDYQSGPENSVTAGFTYNLTPDLQVNPALYVANTAPHHLMGYVVLTWNLPVWKPKASAP